MQLAMNITLKITNGRDFGTVPEWLADNFIPNQWHTCHVIKWNNCWEIGQFVYLCFSSQLKSALVGDLRPIIISVGELEGLLKTIKRFLGSSKHWSTSSTDWKIVKQEFLNNYKYAMKVISLLKKKPYYSYEIQYFDELNN